MLVVALSLGLLASPLPAQDPGARIDELLQRLNDDALPVRETAARELSELGPDALPLLAKRLEGLDGERRGRVQEAMRRIEDRQKLFRVLPPLKTVTLDVAEKPLREVLEEISRQSGIPVDLSAGGFDGPVTLKLKDALPLRAFDEACAKGGGASYRTRRPQDDGLVVPADQAAPGAFLFQTTATPDYPASYAKSYRVRLTQISLTRTNDFRREQSTASLQFDLLWPPLAYPHSIAEFSVSEAVDQQGRSLLLPVNPNNRFAVAAGRRFTRHWMGGAYQSLAIAYPEADAGRIASLKGVLTLVYPGDERTLVFDDPSDKQGQSLELFGLKVTLKECRSNGQSTVVSLEMTGRFAPPGSAAAADEDGLPFNSDEVVVVTRSGARLRSAGMSGSSDGRSHQWELRLQGNVAEPVKQIRIPCILAYHHDSVSFEFKDIPLPGKR
jgi:hypothetical protein